ncbi:MAG: MBL fold metallo-hydrolase [Cyanobacteria bacterium RUI128]|nr:MBL fold metallo-hydrolase [Cyanobacteria bacterium RUI128]
MDVVMLGTGNALVTKCYNTCFVLKDNNEQMLVDGGGGNQILSRLDTANISYNDLHHIFVTHKHIDHILGIIWVIRMILQGCNGGKLNDSEYFVYGHEEVIRIIEDMSRTLIRDKEVKLIGRILHFIPVLDGEEKEIIGHKFKFFDIHSDKAKQFGFSIDGGKLVCCGDEPLNETINAYTQNAGWLMLEAFCLESEADIFNPYEKKHSTVKDSCQKAQRVNVKSLILYHTEDKNIENRKELYTKEGEKYFSGKIYVPDDLEIIKID